MGDFDFGEEHLKFMFERWKVNEHLADTEKLGGENLASAEELIQQAQWFENRLNRYMGNLEKWMEGANSALKKLDNQDE